MKLFKKDNILLGIFLGLLAPVIIYLLLWLINMGLVEFLNDGKEVLSQKTRLMTSIFLNPLIFLRYIKKDKNDKTGRGILLITFVGVVIFFLYSEF